MNVRTITIASIVLLTTITVPVAADKTPSAENIVEKANLAQYYAGQDGRAEIRMKIIDGQGRSRKRQFTVLRKDVKEGGDQLYYVLFHKPADVRNTAFLVKKHATKDDDRWLYLPGLDLVKRISASDKRTSFVGTHFFYEDISGRHHSEDHHELVKATDSTYEIKSTPKNKGSVEFAYYNLTVDKLTGLPKKIAYHDKSGKVYRTIETAQMKDFQGYPTITRMKVTDWNSGGKTLSEVRSVKYDLGLKDGAFQEKALRNAPAEAHE